MINRTTPFRRHSFDCATFKHTADYASRKQKWNVSAAEFGTPPSNCTDHAVRSIAVKPSKKVRAKKKSRTIRSVVNLHDAIFCDNEFSEQSYGASIPLSDQRFYDGNFRMFGKQIKARLSANNRRDGLSK